MASYKPGLAPTNTVTVPVTIDEAYDQSYTGRSEWRKLGAKFKAGNITTLAESAGLKPRKILEVGAGDGSILLWLDQMQFGEEYYALEIASSGVDLINDGSIGKLKEAKKFNGYEIPYPDKSFDLVILSHVLEHVEYERALLREVKRIGVNSVIEVPLDFRWRADDQCDYFMNYGHINIYTPTQIRFLLKTEGFHILNHLKTISHEEVAEYNEFVNGKKERTPEAVSQFKGMLAQKRAQFEGAEEAMKDFLADAYTVLCANH